MDREELVEGEVYKYVEGNLFEKGSLVILFETDNLLCIPYFHDAWCEFNNAPMGDKGAFVTPLNLKPASENYIAIKEAEHDAM